MAHDHAVLDSRSRTIGSGLGFGQDTRQIGEHAIGFGQTFAQTGEHFLAIGRIKAFEFSHIAVRRRAVRPAANHHAHTLFLAVLAREHAFDHLDIASAFGRRLGFGRQRRLGRQRRFWR